MKNLHIFLDAIAALLLIFIGTFCLTFQNTSKGENGKKSEISKGTKEKDLRVVKVTITPDEKIIADGKAVEEEGLKYYLEELKPDLVKISTFHKVTNDVLLAAKSSGAKAVFEISY